MKIQEIEKEILKEQPEQETPKNKIAINWQQIIKTTSKIILIILLTPLAITFATVAASGRGRRRGNHRR